MVSGFRQAATGHFERGVPAQVVQIVGIGVAAGDGQDAGTQDIRHRMGDPQRVAMVGHQGGQRLHQADPLVETRKQQNTTIRTDHAAIKGRGDFLAAKTWQSE